MKVAAVIFEGGATPPLLPLGVPARARDSDGSLVAQMSRVRAAVVLDNLEKLLANQHIEKVILATNLAGLAREARALGAVVDLQGPAEPYQFGRRLAKVIETHRLDAVLYLGGAAAPLLGQPEIDWVAEAVLTAPGRVVVNNPQSADLVGFYPASALGCVEPPDSDNVLGYLLRKAGLERVLTPNTPRLNFDLDTPTDMLVLRRSTEVGPRSRQALDSLGWDTGRLERAMRVLRRPEAEIAIVGRVGPSLAVLMNQHLSLRLRIFSEERGMKGMGRVARGEVVSLLGFFLDEVGPERFFAYLAQVCQAAFFDTRVAFAHRGRKVSEGDRFYADLGCPERITDPMVRRFTEAALASPMPVVLGGHSLVSGGLRLLVEELISQK